MTTVPYSDLLAQVEALAGATLALPEQRRIKIFANRRARKAHRECDYWPHLLHVGEERIVSEEGLLPLAQTGLETIDKIIRIHAEDPFKSLAVPEYSEYYEDVNGIQITGYQQTNPNLGMVISGTLSLDATGDYVNEGLDYNGQTYDKPIYILGGTTSEVGGSIQWNETQWLIAYRTSPTEVSVWASSDDVATPDLVTTWSSAINASGDPVVTATSIYTAFITYLAKIPATYGDGEGEESDVPEPWFEYMAQGAYCDWLRSDGQTEKAMAEEAIAADLLNQQLEKVSRSNGNQVVTRMMSHSTKQSR